MKKIAITLCAMALVFQAAAQEVAISLKPENKLLESAVFNWTTTTFDFGKIKIGVPVSHEFTFTNTGSVPLIITSVKASCGCTVTSYSKDPVQSNAEGFVKATFNAASKGQFSKTVTIQANTEEGNVLLTIRGEVVE